MEDLIHFKFILYILKKHWKLISLSIIIVPLLITLFSYYYVAPVYEAETVLIVNHTDEDNQPSIGNIETSMLLVETYTKIAKNPRVIKKVANKVEEDNYESLMSKIHIVMEHDSQLFSIKVEENDPNRAALLANIVAETLIEEIAIIFNSNSTKVLTPASVDHHSTPTKPNLTLIAVISFVLTAFFITAIAIFLEITNDKYTTIYELSEDLDLQIIGKLNHNDRFLKMEKEKWRGE